MLYHKQKSVLWNSEVLNLSKYSRITDKEVFKDFKAKIFEYYQISRETIRTKNMK